MCANAPLCEQPLHGFVSVRTSGLLGMIVVMQLVVL